MAITGDIYRQEINLIPQDFLLRRQKKKEKYYIFIAMVLITSSFVLLYLYPEIMIRRYENRVSQVMTALVETEAEEKKYASLLAYKEELEEKIRITEEIEKNTISPIELLDRLATLLPRGVLVDSFSFNREKLNISFVVQNPVQVLELMTVLEELEIFHVEQPAVIPLMEREETVHFTLFFEERNEGIVEGEAGEKDG